MVKKIVVIGPESTGKSTLCEHLARHFNTVWVPEYAREYIDKLNRPYKEIDLLKIAESQLEIEDSIAREANKILFCDTDLQVIKVWSEHKYGRCHPWITDQIQNRKYDLYLLTYIDTPWEDDPQREHPHLREYFFNIYHQELDAGARKFLVIKGNYQQRFQYSISAINDFLNK